MKLRSRFPFLFAWLSAEQGDIRRWRLRLSHGIKEVRLYEPKMKIKNVLKVVLLIFSRREPLMALRRDGIPSGTGTPSQAR